MKACSVKDCTKTNRILLRKTNYYCNKHYLQMSRHGKIIVSTRDERKAIIKDDHALIPLGIDKRAGYTIVDKEFAYLDKFKWAKDHYGYAVCNHPNMRLHRLILEAPDSMNVDHINGDPLDNRKSNIRLCTQAQNARNLRLSKLNKSGYKGVSFDKRVKKYEAYIKFNYKRYKLGFFDDPKQAALVRDKKALELHGEYARTNKMLGLL